MNHLVNFYQTRLLVEKDPHSSFKKTAFGHVWSLNNYNFQHFALFYVWERLALNWTKVLHPVAKILILEKTLRMWTILDDINNDNNNNNNDESDDDRQQTIPTTWAEQPFKELTPISVILIMTYIHWFISGYLVSVKKTVWILHKF